MKNADQRTCDGLPTLESAGPALSVAGSRLQDPHKKVGFSGHPRTYAFGRGSAHSTARRKSRLLGQPTWERASPPPYPRGKRARNCLCVWRNGIDYKTTTILLDGRRVKLELWDTSGQGRFCTIFRSYSRGAQGILLVYDITNRWSFDGIDRWIKEIDENADTRIPMAKVLKPPPKHAPGVPRILVGNRLHLAFKRQVPTEQARAYAEKNCMTFFEVSPLCNFNVIESFTELSRIVLMRHGMEKIWRPNRVFSLQDLCCRAIVSCTPVHLIDKLPLPVTIKSHLKSFSMANGMNAVMMHGRSYSLASGAGGSGSKGNSLKRSKSIRPPQSPPQNCSRSNCKIS
ncbi:ras-related protein Rab-40C [Sigmodon hispidus]